MNLELTMRRIHALLLSLSLCAFGLVGASEAAEIDFVPGLSPDQKAILIRGPIEPGDDDRFYEIAEQTPRAIVYLESPGGHVTTGLSIGAEIAIRGYTTLVLEGPGCHSICAVIWVAGVRRYMSPEAQISVHAAYRLRSDANGGSEASESGQANAQIGAFLNELGLSYDAVGYFTFAGPSDDLLPITPEIAQALSIDVYIQNPGGAITPAERPTPRRITQNVSDYAGLVTHCAVLFGVEDSFWRGQAQTVLRAGHDIFGGETFVPLLSEFSDRTKAEIKDKGAVRWCLSTEENLRRQGLPTGISGPSFDCAKAATRTERTICATPDLWTADRAMSALYFHYKRNAGAYRARDFLTSQRAWLGRRNACGDNLSCLVERYSSRLFEFGA